jgi:hypothetical protein
METHYSNRHSGCGTSYKEFCGRNMKREGLNKIKNRKKLWDMFGWNYRHKNHLWKNKHLTDRCKICKWERFMKLYKHSQERLRAKRDINKISL